MLLFQKHTLKCPIVLDIFLTSSRWASNSEISEIVHVAATFQDQIRTKKPFFDSLVPSVVLKQNKRPRTKTTKKKDQKVKTS
jgi:hypothetical protein